MNNYHTVMKENLDFHLKESKTKILILKKVVTKKQVA